VIAQNRNRIERYLSLAHSYQGPAAALSIGFKSVLMGGYFLATGRLWPLIVAHAVYDSVQIVAAVVAMRAATG
jgi:membrane protease YdiL (CAAX protease family)